MPGNELVRVCPNPKYVSFSTKYILLTNDKGPSQLSGGNKLSEKVT